MLTDVEKNITEQWEKDFLMALRDDYDKFQDDFHMTDFALELLNNIAKL